MNWRQFIASIVSSLAWPATLVAAILILKNQLPAIFPFIERLKYKGVEIEFPKIDSGTDGTITVNVAASAG